MQKRMENIDTDLESRAKKREEEKKKEYYSKITKEERDMLEPILLDIFKKMDLYARSKASGKYYIWCTSDIQYCDG